MLPPMLDDAQLAAALVELPQWRRNGDKIGSEWSFDDFATAFSFMTSVAIQADRLGHHPEWNNVYNRVGIDLTTHDAGGVTQYDIDMANVVNKAASRAGGVPSA